MLHPGSNRRLGFTQRHLGPEDYLCMLAVECLDDTYIEYSVSIFQQPEEGWGLRTSADNAGCCMCRVDRRKRLALCHQVRPFGMRCHGGEETPTAVHHSRDLANEDRTGAVMFLFTGTSIQHLFHHQHACSGRATATLLQA